MSGTIKGLAALLLAALILYGLQRTTPGYGEITSPITLSGTQGERIDAKAYAIYVERIHLARSLRTKSFGREQTYTSSGVWVVAEGGAVSTSESLTLTSAAWLGPNGVRYVLSPRLATLPGMLPVQRLEPGLPQPVLMAFEVPEEQAFGGALLVARSALTPLDEEIHIETATLQPSDIHETITIGRTGGALPWTLEAE